MAEADAILEEFLAADTVVIGVPMYNFGIPSTLKSWIDHLAVAGKTFSYSEAGPKGLAGGKRVDPGLVARRLLRPGHPGRPSLQHQESYLRGFFGFIGIPDLEGDQRRGRSTTAPTTSRPPSRPPWPMRAGSGRSLQAACARSAPMVTEAAQMLCSAAVFSTAARRMASGQQRRALPAARRRSGRRM